MNEEFEKEGLKIDKERALTYSQLACPFDCVYCFVEDINFNQHRFVNYLSEKQFELLKQLPKNVQLIMLGCDTEFFQDRTDSLEALNRLVGLKKDISVVSKMSLEEDFIDELRKIDINLKENGNFLTFSESIPCLESSPKWEPKAPDPLKRINTIEKVFGDGIKTLIAIRPLLPSVPNNELEKIIDLTKNYCFGYYSGPLYMKDLNNPVLKDIDLKKLKVEKMQPHWMPEGNEFFKIEDEAKMEFLRETVEKNNKNLFEGASEAITYLKTHEKSGN